jgi:RNA polymerase sigma factor (sigma-70 family)
MHRTIRNLLVDHHRGTVRHPEAAWDNERDGQLPDDCNVAEESIFRALGRDLRAALATLDKTQQDLIFLIYFEQLSTVAASRKIGLKETTARRYHEAALSRLREMIGYSKEEDQDDGR